MRKILVTGSSGLIGSGVCRYFHDRGYAVHGLDNNQRAVFFGEDGDTRWNQELLARELDRFEHHELDVRDRAGIDRLVQTVKPDAIVHAAAQPSHDRAADIPFDDFEINAVGTLNLLEAARRHRRDTVFVFMSTNKVYGDAPNALPLVERPTRWDFADPAFTHGIPESLSIDRCKHSLFGVSKASADLMVQEYGRYFGMSTCCLRCGCLTGPRHAGVQLHGFLSYLIRCHLERGVYNVLGHKGKQVRDNIHEHDVASFIWRFIESPRVGEVYNLGGGKANSVSILELFDLLRERTGLKQEYVYLDQPRSGDHLCYYSDLRKCREHFPGWDITLDLPQTIDQVIAGWRGRLVSTEAAR